MEIRRLLAGTAGTAVLALLLVPLFVACTPSTPTPMPEEGGNVESVTLRKGEVLKFRPRGLFSGSGNVSEIRGTAVRIGETWVDWTAVESWK